jgi:hypothetical protein
MDYQMTWEEKNTKCKTIGLFWMGDLRFREMYRQVRPPAPDSGTLKMDTTSFIETKGTKPH